MTGSTNPPMPTDLSRGNISDADLISPTVRVQLALGSLRR